MFYFISTEHGIDTSVFEIIPPYTPQEIYTTHKSGCGVEDIVQNFFTFLAKTFGRKTLNEVLESDPYASVDIRKHVHDKLERSSGDATVTIKLPYTLLQGKSKVSHLTGTRVLQDKIRMDASIFMSFFENTCEQIGFLIKKLQCSEVFQGIDSLILTGSLSLSPVIRQFVRRKIANVILSPDPIYAALRGAVILGKSQQRKGKTNPSLP